MSETLAALADAAPWIAAVGGVALLGWALAVTWWTRR